jgi:hypothetical protein
MVNHPVHNYRYTLVRHWDNARPMVAWVCLNPSTAGAAVDDPTTRKIRGFSEQWGFGSYLLVNLYPMRATSPADLVAATPAQRIGIYRDLHACLADGIITAAYGDGAEVIFAWGAKGNHPALRARRDAVLALPRPDKPFWCLGLTKSGDPCHPLYLPYTTPRIAWPTPTP